MKILKTIENLYRIDISLIRSVLKPKCKFVCFYIREISLMHENKGVREKRLFTFSSGATYDGEWLGNMRDGYGIQEWPDGAKYEGEWRDNKATGKGKFWHVDGDICKK